MTLLMAFGVFCALSAALGVLLTGRIKRFALCSFTAGISSSFAFCAVVNTIDPDPFIGLTFVIFSLVGSGIAALVVAVIRIWQQT